MGPAVSLGQPGREQHVLSRTRRGLCLCEIGDDPECLCCVLQCVAADTVRATWVVAPCLWWEEGGGFACVGLAGGGGNATKNTKHVYGVVSYSFYDKTSVPCRVSCKNLRAASVNSTMSNVEVTTVRNEN